MSVDKKAQTVFQEEIQENELNKLPMLIVGWDKLTTQVLHSMIQNYQVIIAESIEVADSILTQQDIHLAFVCLSIQNKSGVDYMEQLKVQYPTLPVIIVTMNQSPDSVIRIYKKGAKDVFQTPFFAEIVRTRVNILLENSLYRRRIRLSNKLRNSEILQKQSDRKDFAELIQRVEALQKDLGSSAEEHRSLQSIIKQKDEEILHEKSKTANFARLIVGAMNSSAPSKSMKPDPSSLLLVLAEQVIAAEKAVVDDVQNVSQRMARAAETPIQSITRTVGEIVREDKALSKQELKKTVAQMITQLSADDMYQPQFQKLFKECGVDEATRQWILEELGSAEKKQHKRTTSLMTTTSDLISVPSFGTVSDTSVIKKWDFNIFSYSQDAITPFVEAIFREFSILDRFKIDPSDFRGFVNDVRQNSNSASASSSSSSKGGGKDGKDGKGSSGITYHTFLHAFDVLQTIFLFLTQTELYRYMTRLDIFALLVAGLCQDIDHPGLNNLFQVNAQTPLALTYNDISVLENFHAHRTFSILNNWKILKNLTPGEFQEFRRNVIAGILGTDMSSHFTSFSRLATHIETKPFSRESANDRQLLVVVVLHAADLSNCSKPWRLCKRWCDLMQQEFFYQGDEETRRNLPPSPYMTRANANMPKMMINMIDYCVFPLFSTLARLLSDLQPCLGMIQTNRLQFAQDAGSESHFPELSFKGVPGGKQGNAWGNDGDDVEFGGEDENAALKQFAGDPDHSGTDDDADSVTPQQQQQQQKRKEPDHITPSSERRRRQGGAQQQPSPRNRLSPSGGEEGGGNVNSVVGGIPSSAFNPLPPSALVAAKNPTVVDMFKGSFGNFDGLSKPSSLSPAGSRAKVLPKEGGGGGGYPQSMPSSPSSAVHSPSSTVHSPSQAQAKNVSKQRARTGVMTVSPTGDLSPNLNDGSVNSGGGSVSGSFLGSLSPGGGGGLSSSTSMAAMKKAGSKKVIKVVTTALPDQKK